MTHPVRFVVTDDLRRSRLTVLFRVLLAIPHLVWATVWGYALVFFVPFQWLWALFAGLLFAGGILAFIHPQNTFAAFADILGFVFLVIGAFWIAQAFAERPVNTAYVAFQKLQALHQAAEVLRVEYA